MAVFSERYLITFADGEEVEVDSTQRDVADVEVEAARHGIEAPAGRLLLASFPVLVTRMRGWLAYRRHTGRTDLEWPTFDAIAVEVAAVAPLIGGPTPRGTSAVSSPLSPPAPA